MRSLLSTEQLEEIDGRLAVLDVDPSTGTRFVKFWADEIPLNATVGNPAEGRRSSAPVMSRDVSRTSGTPERRERESPVHEATERDRNRESPDFGGGVDYHEHETLQRERIPLGGSSNEGRERIPNDGRSTPPRTNQPKTPPEDQIPRGCSLHSMEPLREWFCKGADMTSAAEYEAALNLKMTHLTLDNIYNVNIREERWTNFLLEGVTFPAMTVDVIQRGEALAIFERDLIIHFQQISRAAALYIRALLGGIKRAREVYRRVDESTKNFPWSTPTTEEKWHTHAEGVLMVALTTLNLPIEAWKNARLLRAVPNCRLVLMLAYHMLSPALSVEETGLMAYFQTPLEAGPSIVQVTTGLQNWKCAGRRLVEIGGRLPTATQLHQSFIKILSKHLAANKKVNFVFQQQSSTIPMMNPSPTEVVELFSFVEVTLIQYAYMWRDISRV